MNYDQTSLPDNYRKARQLDAEVMNHWMDVVFSRAGSEPVRTILDLGCGTGRFLSSLAEKFDALVIGIDPSTRMLRQANDRPSRGRLLRVNGAAEALPLRSTSVDLIFISMAFHHFTDARRAAGECRRVLRDSGRLCLRTSGSDRAEQYPYVPFFPSSRDLLQKRLPTVQSQRSVFESVSFKTISSEIVTQQVAPDHSVFADKLALKADSVLASLPEPDFQAGLAALRSYAAQVPASPVFEPIDFLVFE